MNVINFNNHKPEILLEKLYLKSSTTLFKHEKLLKTNRFQKITIRSNCYKYFEKSSLTPSSNRR